MNFGHREVCLEHETGPRHPESPDRIRAIRQGLKDCYSVTYVDAPDATREAIEAIHDANYVADFETFCEQGGGNWDADTAAVPKSWDAALASAGLAIWVAEAALDGADGRNTPFSLGRPPGHHAVADDAMGFCFFNNAAVAAQSVLDDGAAERVVILDWDVHHGNGTQNLFYDRDDVYYVSMHERGLYPGTGAMSETGSGQGSGTTLNFAFPPGTTHSAYLAALDDVVAHELTAYDPDLLLVSAGFDAHEHDPISRMRVSTEAYGRMAKRLREMAAATNAALGFVLEGGYGLDTLSESVRMVHEVFDGYEPIDDDGDISDSARQVIDEAADYGFGSK